MSYLGPFAHPDDLPPANDGDMVAVYRPEYKRWEAWTYDRNLFAREGQGGWQYVDQGSEAHCIATCEAFS